MAAFFVFQIKNLLKVVVEIRITADSIEVVTLLKTFKYSRLSIKEIKNEPKFSNVLVLVGEKKEKYSLGSAESASNRADWGRTKNSFFEDCA